MSFHDAISFLVVDDLDPMCRAMKSMLHQLDFKYVDISNSGRDALTKMKTGRYNFVICDINMPVVDGLEVLKEIKTNPEFKNIAVLMITAESKKELIVECAKLGANGFMIKPFTGAALGNKIIEIVQRSKLRAIRKGML